MFYPSGVLKAVAVTPAEESPYWAAILNGLEGKLCAKLYDDCEYSFFPAPLPLHVGGNVHEQNYI